jgi:ATP-dependent helicase HrpB
VLTALGALDATGSVTDRGRRISGVGLHPRLARALLDGAAAVGAKAAAEVVALLDDDARATSASVEDTLRRLRADGSPRWEREVRRLSALVPSGTARAVDPALVVALAYPERLARRRAPGSPVYLMAGGTAAELADSGEWLAVASADRQPGRAQGKIRLAARADQALAERAAPALLSSADEITWADGDVVARHVRRLGAIILRERPLTDPDPARVAEALAEGLRLDGLSLLRWTEAATRLRQRLALLHRVLGPPWPSVADTDLLDAAPRWLGPALVTARRRADLAKVDVHAALSRLLPWPEAGRLDELAPDRLAVPSGARVRVDYSGDEPVLPVKLQETFGWTQTPTIAGGRTPVLLHLLSPAGRPVAITRDLGTFWRDGYRQVRAELRGRYPKHPWPEDPTTAVPTARTNRRG